MNVAIIPARGGSKRIPRKNIRVFAGRPMIAHSIEAARNCGLFGMVLVSTDDMEVAAVAREYGAEVPFLRPQELSDDHTPTAPVIVHALEQLAQSGQKVEAACCIYATAPFVRPDYLCQGYDLLTSRAAATVFSVTTFPAPIYRALRLRDDGRLAMLWPEHEYTRSNDLPEAYHDAGQFYWVDVERFMACPRLFGDDSLPVILPRHLVQDIDTLEDWETAEHMLRNVGV